MAAREPRVCRFFNAPEGCRKGASCSFLHTGEPGGSSESPSVSGDTKYDFVLVLDFEATCDEPVQIRPMEVIEFPVVCVDVRNRKIAWEVQNYVKPLVHPQLTPFCTKLTAIQQGTVDRGVSFPEALRAVEAKMEAEGLLPVTSSSATFIFATCGDWDLKTMLPGQLSLLGLPRPAYFNQWVNVKFLFERHFAAQGVRRRAGGMAAMLSYLGIPLIGHHHSGIDDCRNIAAIVLTLLERGASPHLRATFRLRG